MIEIHPKCLLSVLAGLLISCNAMAGSQDLVDRFTVSGFATIGLVNGGDELLGFRRDSSREGLYDDDDWSLEQDSLFGLQLDASLTPDFSAALQFVGRDRPDNSIEDSIEWAFLRYQLNDEWAVRLGRTGYDLFSLSDYRNVGFAYLWARPPVEFYGPVNFNYADGIDLIRSRVSSGNYFQLQFFAGTTEFVFPDDETGSETIEVDPLIGASASWEFDTWRTRVALASAKLDSNTTRMEQLSQGLMAVPSAIWPEASTIARNVGIEGKRFNYFTLGLAYDNRPWLLEYELGYIDSGYGMFPSVVNTYLSLGYRKKHVTLYTVLAHAESTEDRIQVTPPSNPPIAPNPANPVYALYQGTQFFADINDTDQTTLSLGLRWDIKEDIALKVQWDRHKVRAYGSSLWNSRATVTEDRNLNTFSLNLNFLF